MTIKKTELIVTILHPAEDAPDEMTLEAIGREIDSGDWLGTVSVRRSSRLAKADVADACRELGNDGTFFQDFQR